MRLGKRILTGVLFGSIALMLISALPLHAGQGNFPADGNQAMVESCRVDSEPITPIPEAQLKPDLDKGDPGDGASDIPTLVTGGESCGFEGQRAARSDVKGGNF